MAEHSFPHDAVMGQNNKPDRVFYASDWTRMLKAYFANGIFPNPSTNLQVQSLNNMVVSVQPGRAHIEGKTYVSDETINFATNTANANYNRIDLIIVRLDETERTCKTLYRAGTPASNPQPPTLIRTSDAWELKLAEITVRSGTQVITQADILDTRLSAECGIVTLLPNGVDTASIFDQYHTAWQALKALMASNEAAYNTWYAAFKLSAETTFNQRITDFDAWFAQNKTAIFDAKYFDFDNWVYRAGETKETIFNADGSITEKIINTTTKTEMASRTTTFLPDGSISERTVVPKDKIDVTKTTTFGADGVIREVMT